MAKNPRPVPYRDHAILWWSLLTALFAALIFLLPANSTTMDTYQLSAVGYRAIYLSISVPSLFIWFAAFMASSALGKYAHSIQKSSEAAHFQKLAYGARVLAWSLPLTSLGALILNAVANRWQEFHPWAIIINNYISLVLPFAGFILISLAVRQLLRSAKLRITITNARAITTLFVVGGITYCYLTFKHFNLTGLTSSDNAYFLPVWVMVVTIIVPYLYTWFIGLLSAYQLLVYSNHVDGLLYRKAFFYLAAGVAAVILSSIALQYVNAVLPRVGHLAIDYRLMFNILFRIIGGAGFILLAVGANRLKKIEEV